MAAGNKTHGFSLAEAFHQRQTQIIPPVNERGWRRGRCRQAVLHFTETHGVEHQFADAFGVFLERCFQGFGTAELADDGLLELLPDTGWAEEHVRLGALQVAEDSLEGFVEGDLTAGEQRGKLNNLALSDMRKRQVGEVPGLQTQTKGILETGDGDDVRLVSLDHALRHARGTRGKHQRHHVIGLALIGRLLALTLSKQVFPLDVVAFNFDTGKRDDSDVVGQHRLHGAPVRALANENHF